MSENKEFKSTDDIPEGFERDAKGGLVSKSVDKIGNVFRMLEEELTDDELIVLNLVVESAEHEKELESKFSALCGDKVLEWDDPCKSFPSSRNLFVMTAAYFAGRESDVADFDKWINGEE